MLKALCSTEEITPEYLLRRVRLVDPDFRVGPVTTKPGFTEEQKEARLEFCLKYAGWSAIHWYRVVFYDEFTVFLEPLPATAIYRAGEMPEYTDARLHHFRYGTYNKLSVCYAVNAYAGLVGIWWIHSTTGLDGKQKYLVSGGGLTSFRLARRCSAYHTASTTW